MATTKKRIKWNVSTADMGLIQKIARRAFELKYSKDETNIAMSITACHANGCPLLLDDLLKASDFHFAHDVLGIMRYINTSTGKIRGLWAPRFEAAKERREA